MNSKGSKRLLILGAESLGREAAEVALAMGCFDDISFYDDNPDVQGKIINGIPVVGGFKEALKNASASTSFFVAVGAKKARKRIVDNIQNLGRSLSTLIHPGACIASSAAIGDGCLINYGVHVGPNAVVGSGCLIWSASIVSHDASVGDYCFIAPGVTIGGYASISDGCMIGMNSTICSDIKIGENTVIAIGNYIVSNIEKNTRVSVKGERSKITPEEQESYFFRQHSDRAKEKNLEAIK